MLTLLDKDGPYSLPTGWHEVTTRQFCAVDPLKTVEARATHFAGRPIQVNGLVADALAWMLQPPPLTGGVPFPSDLGQESYLQVESLRALPLNQLHDCLPQVYGLMHGRPTFLGDSTFYQARADRQAANCLDWPITETLPTVAHCLAELQRLSEDFAALYEPDETEAGRKARAAGSDRLAAFSHLNVARHYAERFSTTIDAVYQWPYQQVALFMLQDKISAEIQDNLQNQSTSSHD